MVLSSILFAQISGWVFVDPDKAAGNAMGWRIQVGAFIYRQNAEKTASFFDQKLDLPVYIVVENPWYKVLIGDFRTKEEAEKYLEIIHKMGFQDAFVKESPISLQNDESVSPNPR